MQLRAKVNREMTRVVVDGPVVDADKLPRHMIYAADLIVGWVNGEPYNVKDRYDTPTGSIHHKYDTYVFFIRTEIFQSSWKEHLIKILKLRGYELIES